jgi:hypothetical protein
MKKLYLSLFVLLVSGLLLVSCKPSVSGDKPAIQKNIGVSELMWFIRRDNGLVPSDAFIAADKYYVMVDEDWFKSKIVDGFNDYLFKNGVSRANAKKNDCDDFSRNFSCFVRNFSIQSSFLEYDISAGELYYTIPSEMNPANPIGITGHAINVAVVLDKSGNKKIIYIEPQGPLMVQLEEETKKNYVSFIGF